MHINVKVLKVNIWDEDTGESDVTIEANGLTLVCFSDDFFEAGQEFDAKVSLLVNGWDFTEPNIKFIDQDEPGYYADVAAEITNVKLVDNDLILTADCGEITIPLYIINNKKKHPKVGEHIIATGRLDIMR